MSYAKYTIHLNRIICSYNTWIWKLLFIPKPFGSISIQTLQLFMYGVGTQNRMVHIHKLWKVEEYRFFKAICASAWIKREQYMKKTRYVYNMVVNGSESDGSMKWSVVRWSLMVRGNAWHKQAMDMRCGASKRWIIVISSVWRRLIRFFSARVLFYSRNKRNAADVF